MNTLLHDLRLAVRLLRKSPLFTSVVVATMAIAIGLNTTVFSAIESLLLRPLPGSTAPEALVQVYRTRPGIDWGSSSIPHYGDMKERTAAAFDGFAYWTFSSFSVSDGDRPQRLMGQIVSADYFTTLGVRPLEGRFFVPAEDSGRGAHPVVVLSYSGRRTIFGSDDTAVGRTVLLNGQRMEVIGVAPPEFRGTMPLLDPVAWAPLMQMGTLSPERLRAFDERGNNFGNVIARLKDGVSPEQAAAVLETANRDLAALYPDQYEQSGTRLIRLADAGLHPSFRAAQVGLSAVILGVVVMLLLIACVNVSNLFLARARDRAREMAIRLSVGATRSRLIRQLLVESLLLSLLAGGAGLLVAAGANRVANAITMPISIGARPDLQLNAAVLAFTFTITVLAGLLFGVAPALSATRPSLVPALKGDAPAGGNRSPMRNGLIVAQMALSIVLLTCAGLFLANLRLATSLDVGFTIAGGTTASVAPGLQGYDRARSTQFYATLFERLRATPGVTAVGMIDALPLGIGSSDTYVEIPGYTPAEGEGMNIHYARISPEYFEAIGTPLLRGRDFAAADDSAAALTMIVNQRFVERFWPDGDGLGRSVTVGTRTYTVIGVVATGKYLSLGESPRAFMYFSHPQRWTSNMQLVLRGSLDEAAQVAAFRREIAALDPQMPIVDLHSLERHLGTALLPARIAGGALGLFGLIGLLIASVGIYGVMAYSVGQRQREIGVRVALGATAGRILRLIVGQGLRPVLLGCVLGLGGAAGAFVLIRSVLYGTGGATLMSFVVAPLALLLVATAALLIPAARAARLDPQVALRSD